MRIRVTVLILAALSAPTYADEAACYRRALYTESGGETLRDLAINAEALLNLAKVERKTVCQLIKARIVRGHKTPPKELAPFYDAVGNAARRSKADVSHGANSWNRGKKPAYKGAVKRQTKKQVFYAKADYGS